MIMEIFLADFDYSRDVCIITIFSAQIYILNEIWDVVMRTLPVTIPNGLMAKHVWKTIRQGCLIISRHDRPVLLYGYFAVIGYMLGMASFKLVDMILNWISAGWASVFLYSRSSVATLRRFGQNAMYGGQMLVVRCPVR